MFEPSVVTMPVSAVSLSPFDSTMMLYGFFSQDGVVTTKTWLALPPWPEYASDILKEAELEEEAEESATV